MAGAASAPRALLRAAARPRYASSSSTTSQSAASRTRLFYCQSPNWTTPTSSNPNVSPWRPSSNTQWQQKQQQHSRFPSSSWTQFVSSRRAFSSSSSSQHGHVDPPKPGEELHVTFVDKDGQSHEFEVAEGDNLLDIAQANDLDMEGACGGSCACSTCHVIVESDHYDKMEEPDDDENDMLDLAFGLTETSRLGCQVKMSKDLDGLVVKLPSMTRNLQASDFK